MHIIPNEDGLRSIPSWVSFGDEKILVGGAAKNAFGSNPENTVFDIQRLLGRNMAEVDMQQAAKHWPFQVQEKDGLPVVSVQYLREPRDFTPQEISGMLLGKMKETAEAYLGQKVTHAVVTVPKCEYLNK
jgi:heat shock protein 5